MLKDDLQNFEQNLYKYLVAEEECTMGLLVKKHSSNLQTKGDFSFLNAAKPWQEFLFPEQTERLNETLLKCVNKDIAGLIDTSKDWPIPIVKAEEVKDRIHLFIDRQKSIRLGFQNATNNIAVLLQRISIDTPVIKIDPYCENSNSLAFLRLKCLKEVLKNLYLIHTYPKEQNLIIVVTWRSECDHYQPYSNVHYIFCGPVLNNQTGLKEKTITASEFIKQRQDELTLIAKHRYGIRESMEDKCKEFIAHMGQSAVTFELLQTKCGSPVKIASCSSGGPTKGPAFILYNCARLETLIRTFNEKVVEGIYPPLPSLENTDLTLLTDKDEWCLIFTYIMGLPSLLKASFNLKEDPREYDEGICVFRPHFICNFLSSMVKAFSQYYRRVRILTEPRKHLLPVMFARIHMLIILNDTLKLCLRILNIKSVSQMYESCFFP
ncbi:DALR anticodon-binding domain-containing protein 3 [Maniola jurtina]|uniref:DALR anticodon-binding domain-containing protein 3 n=1 Tax=Maniola jurtina TaxID=191418 RepID=UPI001E68BD59|nr:DALR anticodon-binding domain-containing protein 3 [Maniola jurtina]